MTIAVRMMMLKVKKRVMDRLLTQKIQKMIRKLVRKQVRRRCLKPQKVTVRSAAVTMT